MGIALYQPLFQLYNKVYHFFIAIFRYYSELKKSKSSLKNWKLKEKDTLQIAGYVEGLKKEYPEARISPFVIDCFGNQGFRVFEVD